MSKTIRIIVIDPHKRTVSESHIEPTLQGLQHAIGDNNIEIVYIDNNDIMYVDEEGLFKENQAFFIYNKRPFAGKTIILGDDKRGATRGTTTKVTTIAAAIGFHSPEEICAMNLGY